MSTPCWHVTTAAGDVYGVAAATATDARAMVAARLADAGSDDWPNTARRMRSWDAPYGTVLAY